MKIVWDAQITAVEAGPLKLRIRTGMSQALRNKLAVLRLHGLEGQRVHAEIMGLADQISEMQSSADLLPNVPELLLKRCGEVLVAVAWGIVVLDWRQRRGEYRFVIVLAEELEDVLSRVFELERILASVG